MSAPEKITIKTTVNASPETVWKCWNTVEDIIKWNAASPDWHTPKANNNVTEGGEFSFRMEAKDGSFGFDFFGIYDIVDKPKQLSYTMGDGRKVDIHFSTEGDSTHIVQTFEAESENPIEMQRGGWQSILDNFKKYTESI
jgi:uncharacterized protein YndB with AHSA1/START domain